MPITDSATMKDALQNGSSHFCPVCRSHELIIERLDVISPLHAEQDAACTDCKSTWTISYAFSEILKLESNELLMKPDQLREKYDGSQGTNWGQHPDYPMKEWQAEVCELDTRLGYWEWVTHRLQESRKGD